MQKALEEARIAFGKDEIPVGAVIVCRGKIVARAHNLTETLNDPTAHAEMQAITAACNTLGGKYLDQCTLYVTLEPCLMCAGALAWAQLGRLIYAAQDPKKGYSLCQERVLHPKTEVSGGLMAGEAGTLLKDFFALKR
ncbi:MAG: nucleoside deaminase [Bacteroidales bacterium]|jgi:tRNA(adenine34) deaminase|nr:nucleoside deaminase [Bacteroidales bacterium]MDD2825226.1 nucleoside deaminase [Bacteroidales bacterium]MDD3100348.1 nucleoside deaminase [Bacteroidales bacterium]MDD3639227.1 nucleoside deaminase [Bacteroidales bacterium]MDD3943918.1 nucleoside deaminase [Bacteroidales bacterium]